MNIYTLRFKVSGYHKIDVISYGEVEIIPVLYSITRQKTAIIWKYLLQLTETTQRVTGILKWTF